jgi:hypothetical protein
MVFYKELPHGKKLLEKLRGNYLESLNGDDLQNKIRHALIYSISDQISAQCAVWHFNRICQWSGNEARNITEIAEIISTGDWDLCRDGQFNLMEDVYYLYVAYTRECMNNKRAMLIVIHDPTELEQDLYPAHKMPIVIQQFPGHMNPDFRVDVRDYC